MLEQAQQRVAAHGLTNVELMQMDAAKMDFADSAFDIVVAAYVVTAVPDYRALMSEIVRVCRSGGRVVLLNHFTQDASVIAAVEKVISATCAKIGFRTDLSVDDVINGWPLGRRREERVKPFGMWRVVECVNTKAAPVTDRVASQPA
jgi:phosphatidylethanolamine/phosphatidyl-N-methylethanolamine N-methyltransferase